MDNLPGLQKQNTGKNPGSYRAYKFPTVLSETQAGKLSEWRLPAAGRIRYNDK